MATTGDRRNWLGAGIFGASRGDAGAESQRSAAMEPPRDLTSLPDSRPTAPAAGEPDPGPDAMAHSRRLLHELQRDSKTIGTVPAIVVMRRYDDLMVQLGWTRLGWMAVARRFGKLTHGKAHRTIVERGISRRLLCYEIPHAGAGEAAEIATRKRSATVPARLAALEMATAGLVDRIAQLHDLLSTVAAACGTAGEVRP